MILPLLMGGLGAAGSLLGGAGGAVSGAGDIFGGITKGITRIFGSKKAKQKQRRANRAARAAAGEVTTGVLGDPGEIGALGQAGPAGAVAAGVAGGGDRAVAASNALTTLITGGSDKMVLAAARAGRASKNDILTMLQALDSIDISTAEGAQQRPLGVSDKILLANEIEKIFRGRKRTGIPRSLVRMVKQIRYLKKMLGVASAAASFGRKKR